MTKRTYIARLADANALRFRDPSITVAPSAPHKGGAPALGLVAATALAVHHRATRPDAPPHGDMEAYLAVMRSTAAGNFERNKEAGIHAAHAFKRGTPAMQALQGVTVGLDNIENGLSRLTGIMASAALCLMVTRQVDDIANATRFLTDVFHATVPAEEATELQAPATPAATLTAPYAGAALNSISVEYLPWAVWGANGDPIAAFRTLEQAEAFLASINATAHA